MLIHKNSDGWEDLLFLNKKLYVRKNLYIRNLIPKNKYRIQKKSKMANYRILTKNDLRNHYFAIGEEALKRIDVDQPITLICNGKVYKNRNIDKSLGYGHLYARKEFFDDNHLEVDDRLVFDIEESNTIKVMVVKKEEVIDLDSQFQSTFKEEFLDLINELANNFKENEWCFRASEENVRAELVDPILKALGWKMPYLRREFDHMDYILCNDRFLGEDSKKLIIEAKKYREQLLTDKKEGNDSKKNEDQIVKYMKDKHFQYGILTNGLRWCLFASNQGHTNIEYKGEINIQNPEQGLIWSFFDAILNKIDCKKIDSLCLEKKADVDKKPESIIIGFEKVEKLDGIIIEKGEKKKTYKARAKKGYAHCYANYDIARICKNVGFNLTDKQFFRDILSNNSDRTSDGKISGDYGIYEKITLIQEINSTFDLGLDITAC